MSNTRIHFIEKTQKKVKTGSAKFSPISEKWQNAELDINIFIEI